MVGELVHLPEWSHCEKLDFFYLFMLLQEMADELELALRIAKEMEEFETTEMAVFSSKTDLLSEELAMLNTNISLKLEILKPYVEFLKSTSEVC